MSKANDLLLKAWTETTDREVTAEYRPFAEIYIAEHGNTKGIRDWLKSKNWQDFRLDFALITDKVFVEVQGFGGQWSHKGKNAHRDIRKHNQLLSIGWVGLYFPAGEVSDHPKIIVEQIENFLNNDLDKVRNCSKM